MDFQIGDFSDAIPQGLRRFDSNLVSEKSAHRSDFSLFPPDRDLNGIRLLFGSIQYLLNIFSSGKAHICDDNSDRRQDHEIGSPPADPPQCFGLFFCFFKQLFLADLSHFSPFRSGSAPDKCSGPISTQCLISALASDKCSVLIKAQSLRKGNSRKNPPPLCKSSQNSLVRTSRSVFLYLTGCADQ